MIAANEVVLDETSASTFVYVVIGYPPGCFSIDYILDFVALLWRQVSVEAKLEFLLWLAHRGDWHEIAESVGLFEDFEEAFASACGDERLLGRCCRVAFTFGEVFGLWQWVARE
jgi:hypothetical protein